ncbi:MAG: hypothetical protein PHU04_03285 [Candidatus Peribacteraceae bacterium]|nr:hypothetical protein [Candidatus Peribacteraceae bacterium]
MEMDPHTLQQILEKIHQQMRCPQCGKKVPVNLEAIKVISEEAMLLQLKCEGCNAYIVLQASLAGVEQVSAPPYEGNEFANASSTLTDEKSIELLRKAVESSGGSFTKMFRKEEATNHTADPGTQIA